MRRESLKCQNLKSGTVVEKFDLVQAEEDRSGRLQPVHDNDQVGLTRIRSRDVMHTYRTLVVLDSARDVIRRSAHCQWEHRH
jgi:hypothetical protein